VTVPSAAPRVVATTPFTDQKPGTSGLRKRTPVFQQPHYLENFVQALLDEAAIPSGASLVIGGDGRFLNREAVGTIIRMAAGNGITRVIVGRGGLLSTPAASHLIRQGAAGGIILSASHNPGGPDGDFGIKYNAGNGGPAPEQLTEGVFERSKTLRRHRISDAPPIDLDRLGETRVESTTVEVIDPVADYAALMRECFDFDAIRRLFAGGFRMRLDAMNAIGGPYATAILEGMLGAPAGSVVNAQPLEDFGGLHPDPRVGHGLHDDRGAATDGDAPDAGLQRRAAGGQGHGAGGYQIRMRSAGAFHMPSPGCVPKASWKASRLTGAPIARYRPGECGSAVSCCSSAASR